METHYRSYVWREVNGMKSGIIMPVCREPGGSAEHASQKRSNSLFHRLTVNVCMSEEMKHALEKNGPKTKSAFVELESSIFQ